MPTNVTATRLVEALGEEPLWLAIQPEDMQSILRSPENYRADAEEVQFCFPGGKLTIRSYAPRTPRRIQQLVDGKESRNTATIWFAVEPSDLVPILRDRLSCSLGQDTLELHFVNGSAKLACGKIVDGRNVEGIPARVQSALALLS